MKINYTYPIKNCCQYKNTDNSYKNEIQEQYLDNTLLGIEYPRNYKNAISFTGNSLLSDENIRNTFPCFSDDVSIALLRQNFKKREKFNKLKILCEKVEDKKYIEYLITKNQNTNEAQKPEDIIKQLSNICDNLSEEEIEEYKIFYGGENGKDLNNRINEKGLTIDDKIMLFKFGFNTIQSIDVYNESFKNNELELSTEEKISLVQAYKKYNSNLENMKDVITNYQQVRNPYISAQKLSVEDGALCCAYYSYRNNNSNKRQLTLNSFIDRFIEIRNKNVENTDKKIVQRGKPQELRSPIKYPVHLALKWAYEGKTDDDIKKEYRQIELITMGYDIITALELSSLNDDQFIRYNQFIKYNQLVPFLGESIAYELARLDDQQYEKYKQLISDGKEEYVARDIVKLDNNQEQRYNQLISEKKDHITAYAIAMAQLDDQQYEKYKQLISDGKDDETALDIAQLDSEQELRYKELISQGEDYYIALDIAKLNDQQYEKYKQLISDGKEEYVALDIVKLNNNQEQRYNQLISEKEDHLRAYDIAQLDSEQELRYKKLISQGQTHSKALAYAKLDNEQYQRFNTLKSQKILFDYSLLTLDDRQYEKYTNLIAQGEKHFAAFHIAQLNDQQYKKYTKLIAEGKKHYVAFEIAQLNEQEYKKYIKLITEGKKHSFARVLAKLDGERCQRFDTLEFQKKHFNYSILELDDRQYEKYTKLIAKGIRHIVAFDLAKLDSEQELKYNQLIAQGKTHKEALVIARLTKEELQRLNKRSRNLTDYEAYILAKETTLSFLTPEQIKELPENIFYLISTGQSKDIHDAMQKAIKKAIENNFQCTAVAAITRKELSLLNNNIRKDSNSVYNSTELTFSITNDDELNVKYNRKPNEFNVLIKKEIIDGKTLLYIQDNNSDKKYIAYNGAIALIDANNIIPKDANGNDVIDERTKRSLLSLNNMYPEKQSEILAKASKEFIFNITDENGESIIGQGLNGEAPYMANNYSDKDIKEYLGKKLTYLKQNNQLTAENLLRIFPKDAILIIRPYAQEDSNMLYSIGAQWYSKDNNRWEMRIHSTDLNYADDDAQWIFRLGYSHSDSLNNDVTTYFQFTDTEPFYNFDGEFSGDNSKDSHIYIKSPITSNNLLNNVDFQKIIQQISKICCK